VAPFLWIDAVLLAVSSVVAVLDLEVRWRDAHVGRPVYGALVLAGLVGVWTTVLRTGSVPLPGFVIVACAIAYLPFLSSSFIDLGTTDRLAVERLEDMLLRCELGVLRTTSGSDVIRLGRRSLRVEWEGRAEGDATLFLLNVYPSLLPVTVSRPHVARIESRAHLERIRARIRARRGSPPPA